MYKVQTEWHICVTIYKIFNECNVERKAYGSHGCHIFAVWNKVRFVAKVGPTFGLLHSAINAFLEENSNEFFFIIISNKMHAKNPARGVR